MFVFVALVIQLFGPPPGLATAPVDLAARAGARTLFIVGATLSRVTADPEICGGQPCIRGMRFPVATVLRYLAGGYTAEQLVEEFPELELEDVRESLRYAAWLASGRILALPPAA